MLSQPVALLFILFYATILPWLIWKYSYAHLIVPCAVVQISLGILLGPTLLGRLAPEISNAILSSTIRHQIDGISIIAVLFFALISGLHIDLNDFKGAYKKFIAISFSSVAVPFILGAIAANLIWLKFPFLANNQTSQANFIIAIAIAISVTALPVLGAILSDMNLIKTPLGQWGLGLAAFNDAALWMLVSILLAGGESSTSQESGKEIFIILFSLIYIFIMYFLIKRILIRIFNKIYELESFDGIFIFVILFTVASSLITEYIGVHYIIGAFVAGTVLPQNLKNLILNKLEKITILLLSPFFFISTGLKVNLEFTSHDFVFVFIIITTVTVIGKYLGTSLTAIVLGYTPLNSLALGSLMQAKGMMELAVLTIFVDAGFISNSMFSIMTLMALACTALAMPLTKIFLNKNGAVPSI